MTELILAALVGLIVGVAGTIGIVASQNNSSEGDQTATAQIEVQKQLTNTDLLEDPCSEPFIAVHSNLLCRELFCRMQQRGIDAKTGAGDCESIGNIANTLEIQRGCKALEEEERRSCEELFFKRK